MYTQIIIKPWYQCISVILVHKLSKKFQDCFPVFLIHICLKSSHNLNIFQLQKLIRNSTHSYLMIRLFSSIWQLVLITFELCPDILSIMSNKKFIVSPFKSMVVFLVEFINCLIKLNRFEFPDPHLAKTYLSCES